MTRFADVDSDTPHGPRRVPAGHISTHERIEPRRTIPHGDLDADGRRKPAPSTGSKILVLGGASLVAVALTAGTLLAGRKIVEAISGDGDDESHARRDRGDRPRHAPFMPPYPGTRPHSSSAPRYAAMGDDERADMQSRIDARRRAERRRVAELRARAERSRRDEKSGNMIDNITNSANRFTDGIGGLMASLTTAVGGFRSVAGQTGGIINEFNQAVDTVRNILGGGDARAANERPFRASDQAARRRDDAAHRSAQDAEERRAHRL
ncbi:MAG: hypothetical protein Q4F71_04900 [Paracoccus sp. (in: a-proteobacteria)]|nr:hypothetical protein [Paracoccus sp. (in: a-proteobacteria)]